LVARHELEDATVILVVDGLHRFMGKYEDAHHENSPFYVTLSSIGDLARNGFLLLTCCTALVSRPIEGFLKASSRKWVYLPVASLDPPDIVRNGVLNPVFEMDNTIMKILVEDCGGHGRAFEILWRLTEDLNWDNCNVSQLMQDLRRKLITTYGRSAFDEKDIMAIVRAVFTNQYFLYNEHLPDTDKFPEELAAPGLVRLERKGGGRGCFRIPYIWLWVMTEASNGTSLLTGYQFDDYNDFSAAQDQTLPSGCSWENFEVFNARFQ